MRIKIAFFLIINSLCLNVWPYKSFELSSIQGCQSNDLNSGVADLLKEAYVNFFEKNHLVSDSIPKIIHFIWVGGKLPYIYNFCIDSWKMHHPDWEIILWDDHKISQLNMKNRKLFDSLINNGAKADVARYEILSQYGGFYIDIDFFCLKPLDFYAERSTIFLGNFLPDVVGNGIIGVTKNSDFINKLIIELNKIDCSQSLNFTADEIMDKFGPKFITRSVYDYLKKVGFNGDVLILPSSYLHSFPNTERDQFWNYQKSLVDIVDEYVYPETIAVHLWSVSWVNLRSDKHQGSHFLSKALDIAGLEFINVDVVRKEDGATPLHIIAQKGNADHIKSLLQAGLNINVLDKNKNTPLMYAVISNNLNNIKTLISLGADITISNANHQTCFDLIKNSQAKRLFSRLKKNQVSHKFSNTSALIEAIKANKEELVESLLRNGYKVNVCDEYHRTPLFYAAISNNLKVAKLLILHGAKCLDQIDVYGKKIVDYASPEFIDNIINNNINRKIIIITCSYNNEKYLKKSLLSLFNQTYDNWECYYIDDNSQDQTFNLAQDLVSQMGLSYKFHFIKNNQNLGAMHNQYHAISQCKDNNIIVILDGDDCFYGNDVLQYVNKVYRDPDVWLTYGSYIPEKNKQIIYIEDTTLKNCNNKNFFRNYPWVFSHLRTFYAGLFKRIKKEDLMYEGDFVKAAPDVAAMLPMLEMAANGKYRCIKKLLYVYNDTNNLCEFRVDFSRIQRIVGYIRKKSAYDYLHDCDFYKI